GKRVGPTLSGNLDGAFLATSTRALAWALPWPAPPLPGFGLPAPSSDLEQVEELGGEVGVAGYVEVRGRRFRAERLDPGGLGAAHAGVGRARVVALDAGVAVLAYERVVLRAVGRVGDRQRESSVG